ncbi:spondin-1-like [Montipora capricornis]|uniref:spondin-1-like n=1 Tax=Montipora capricornis TaxID=246305 RepID=UPI0035F1A595
MLSVKFLFFILLLVPHDTDGWRRRRRRRCPAADCKVSSWNSWSSCSTDTCGQQGLQRRSRTVTSSASCGGAACPTLDETRQCYGSKPVDCQVSSWDSWSSCSTDTCGQQGSQRRSRTVTSSPSCGGAACPTLDETRQCYGSKPVDCQVSSWDSWSSCSTDTCGQQGSQRRSRTVTSSPSCGGAACPTLDETRQCYGSKPVDCQVSSWDSWSSCSTDTCGQQGSQRRSRTVTSSASCGGAACPTLDETRQCYGSKQVDCQVSSWSQWSACPITCGVSGIQSSARNRIITEKCGGACPYTLRKTRQCQNITCLNGGTLQEQSCSCKEGYTGDCCETRNGNTHSGYTAWEIIGGIFLIALVDVIRCYFCPDWRFRLGKLQL